MGAIEFFYLAAGLVVGILATAGYAVLSLTPADFQIARRCFIGAAIIFASIDVVWGVTTTESVWVRAPIVALVGAIALLGVIEGLRWINSKESLWKTQQSPPQANGDQIEQRVTPKTNIPIMIKRAPNISPYDWQRNPFGDRPSPEDLFAVGPLYISNNSPRTLTLDVSMGLVDTAGGPEWIYPATGLSLMGLKLGRDDLESRVPTDRPPFLLSPLTIEPGKTLYGRLGFLRPGDGKHQVGWRPTLIITDVARSVTVRIPIGEEYTGAAEPPAAQASHP